MCTSTPIGLEGATREKARAGCGLPGRPPLRSWASTQNVIALSSGGAEFCANVRGASIGLGMQSLLQDL